MRCFSSLRVSCVSCIRWPPPPQLYERRRIWANAIIALVNARVRAQRPAVPYDDRLMPARMGDHDRRGAARCARVPLRECALLSLMRLVGVVAGALRPIDPIRSS